MLKNYLKIAWRNLFKSKTSSVINISGLAVGMAVAVLISLWIFDEVNFDKYHQNYGRIVQVMQHQNYNGQIGTQTANPAVLGEEIRRLYGNDFKYVLQASWNFNHSLTYGDKILLKAGMFFEPANCAHSSFVGKRHPSPNNAHTSCATFHVYSLPYRSQYSTFSS